jgi:hypothetical protein
MLSKQDKKYLNQKGDGDMAEARPAKARLDPQLYADEMAKRTELAKIKANYGDDAKETKMATDEWGKSLKKTFRKP